MSGLPGDSIKTAREYMDSLLVESRIIGAEKPSTRFEFLGEVFETPIMTVALSHIDLTGISTMTKQLQSMMYRTGSSDLKHIDPTVIWEK